MLRNVPHPDTGSGCGSVRVRACQAPAGDLAGGLRVDDVVYSKISLTDEKGKSIWYGDEGKVKGKSDKKEADPERVLVQFEKGVQFNIKAETELSKEMLSKVRPPCIARPRLAVPCAR